MHSKGRQQHRDRNPPNGRAGTMYIKRVVLENLRGFRQLNFDFERPDGRYSGWAVITGDNAAGKTAFLKALALALVGTDTARALQPSLQGWIRRGTRQAVIAVEIMAGEGDKFAQGRRYEHPFWSELLLSDDPGPELTLTVGDKYRGKGKGPKHGPWAENPSGWYSVGYGPFVGSTGPRRMRSGSWSAPAGWLASPRCFAKMPPW